MSIQVAVDVPSSPYKNAPSTSAMKPLEELSPVLQRLCGICSVSEDDINGDIARSEALRELPCNYSMDELQSVLLDSINDCNTGKLYSHEDVMQLISCKIQEWK